MRIQGMFIVQASILLGVLMVAKQGVAQPGPQARKAEGPSHKISGSEGHAHYFTDRRVMVAAAGENHTFEFVAPGYSAVRSVVKGAPYSAEAITEMKQTLSDGNRIIRKNTASVYRDSEGRTRREQKLGAIGPWAAQGEAAEMIFIHDPVADVHYVLSPADRTARKMTPPRFEASHSEAEPEEQTGFHWIDGEDTAHGEAGHDVTISLAAEGYRSAAQQVSIESLGTRMIEGVEAEGTRSTMTIPAGEIGNELPIEIVSERWYSAELQTLVASNRNDPRFGEHVYRLIHIQRVEPLPSLFQVPSDYTIQEGPAFCDLTAERMIRFRPGSVREKAAGDN